MPVAVFTRFAGVDSDRYDEIIAALHLDLDPPTGAILHVATESPEGIVTCEIWQTADAFHRFFQQRLRPILVRRRIRDEPTFRVVPLHNLYAPDLLAIERLGAVSTIT